MPFPFTVLAEVATGVPPQLALSGPKRLKVIMPVGFTPFESTALSEIVPLPTLIVIAISDWFVKWWWLLFVIVVGAAIGIGALYKRSDALRLVSST